VRGRLLWFLLVLIGIGLLVLVLRHRPRLSAVPNRSVANEELLTTNGHGQITLRLKKS